MQQQSNMEDEGQEGEEGPGVNVTVMCSCRLYWWFSQCV